MGASGSPAAGGLPATAPGAFKGVGAPRGEPDDLKNSTGITGKVEQGLHDAGVYHDWQIADLDAEQLAALDRKLKLNGQIEKEDWVAQAKKLVEATAA